MSRPAVFLIIVAALTGTPLRQAEAADDFGRSFRELPTSGNMEEPDGGVGDDSGVGTLSASHADMAVNPFSQTALFLPAPIAMGLPIALDRQEARRERVWCPSKPPNRRHAWLQIFLF